MNNSKNLMAAQETMSSSEESKHDPESGRPVEKQSFFAKYLKEVDVKRAYLPMLACCFVSGLTDGTIYNAYGTFVSMQTGNTIFVALGTTGFNNKPYGWARSLCSIGFFIIGSFCFARFAMLLGGRRRGVLGLSFLGQSIFVMLAAALIQGGVIDGSYPSHRAPGSVDFKEIAVIALLSFQAAGQIVSSRSLSVGEIPTVVVTSMLCDLMSDPALLAWAKNDKRNRRFMAFVLTLVGAICGGWISKASGAVQPSLWTVAGIKLVLSIGWLFWTEK
ncbi:DUF1275 domain protein [Cordyceps fumosorosea ARSEF 2679]|uniref:DUF1275 domain protein n=1 Tax=Cordyceps fumosorosea (strain ARSEF 2679) TaxID=1081104 RepID=A0A168BQM2_CORFA|nr:DUF1275 domain protein [Cordyceps fumosorosea ARSEF 2679]OAA70426.1 DUF1275 domain protein [Cordyceps fumosorosea ARSEF 2679]